MLIAVMSDRPDLQGHVPDSFEEAAALLIIETDDASVAACYSGEAPEAYAAKVVDSGSEAVVCGPHIGKDCFTPIADACITRYIGQGLDVLSAAKQADVGTLPLIPEYEGGPGCSSGTGECGDCAHGDEDEEAED